MSAGLNSVIARLVALRKERGLRQADIAELLGVGQQLISHYERGEFVTLDALDRYAEALDCKIVMVLAEPGEY